MARRSQVIWTFAITSIALFMVTLDNLVVTTALPVIRHDLNANLQQLEWTINAYTLTFAVLLLTGAALGDRFGRRRIFSIGLAVFTLGSAASALAQSPTMLIIARAVQGAGAAMVTPLTLTILSAAVPGESSRRRARRVGRHRRPRSRGRADRRRRHRAGHLVALDLLGERADRPAARAARADPAERDPRRRQPSRPRRPGHRQRWTLRDRLGPGPRQPAGLDEPGDPRDPRRRRRARGGVRHLRAPLARADAPDPLLQQPDVHAAPTSHRCSCSSACSAACSCSPSSSRRCKGFRRSTPGCASFPGRRCRSSWRRPPVRSRTASTGAR